MPRRAAAALILSLTAAQAQPAARLPTINTPTPTRPTLAPAQLRQLLAPIALYPDALLANILAAATHPAQIVEARRFLADPAQASQSTDQLTGAAASHDWDPSVTALLATPQVLEMLDDNLEWTEHLGHAYAAQQPDVAAAIQSLRQLAQQAGTLATGPNDTVITDGPQIQILPPSPQEIYLPTYNPACVFGPDPGCALGQDQVAWSTDALLPEIYLQLNPQDRRHHQPHPQGAAPVTTWHHAPLAMPATHTSRYTPAATQLHTLRGPAAISAPIRPVFHAPAVQHAPVAIAPVGFGRK